MLDTDCATLTTPTHDGLVAEIETMPVPGTTPGPVTSMPTARVPTTVPVHVRVVAGVPEEEHAAAAAPVYPEAEKLSTACEELTIHEEVEPDTIVVPGATPAPISVMPAVNEAVQVSAVLAVEPAGVPPPIVHVAPVTAAAPVQ